jgi:hypothetical protein
VDETLDPLLYLDEYAEIGDARYVAFHHVTR